MKQIDSKKDCFFTEIGITLRRNGFGAPPTDGRFCLRRIIRPRRRNAQPALCLPAATVVPILPTVLSAGAVMAVACG